MARDFKQPRGGGNWDKRPRPENWGEVPTTNDAFVEYYKGQGIVPEEVRLTPANCLPPPAPPFLGRRRAFCVPTSVP